MSDEEQEYLTFEGVAAEAEAQNDNEEGNMTKGTVSKEAITTAAWKAYKETKATAWRTYLEAYQKEKEEAEKEAHK